MLPHPLIAKIDLDAIIHNCGIFRSMISDRCKICPAVKCNAFGHDIKVTLPAFKKAGVEMLSVATLEEAFLLRQLGWNEPIILFGSELSIYQRKQKEEIALYIVEHQIRITITRKDDIKTLVKAARKCKKTAVIHLMLDTGMHRMGVCKNDIIELFDYAKKHKEIYIEGLYTHLATADEYDKSYSNQQLKKFNTLISALKNNGVNIPIVHSAGSAASVDLQESHFNMIRPGISVYGCHSSQNMHNTPNFKPAMKVISFLTLAKSVAAGSYIGYGCTYKAAKNITIGLVPIGYGDGYDRRLSNNGHMTIEGQLVPVVGRISMDQTIVDISLLKNRPVDTLVGQEITVVDNQRNAPNSAESLAVKLGTIPNEILTKFGSRILRIPV